MINKILRKNHRKLIIVLLCVIIAFFSIYRLKNLQNEENNLQAPLDYGELIATQKDDDNMYVSLKIADIPYEIAEQRVNYSYIKYYILYDENDYTYVAKLSTKTYNKIKEEYQKNSSDFSYTLTGFIYKIPKKLKKIIIDVYNENNVIDKINDDNYYKYFGSTYIDDSYTKHTSRIAIYELIVITSSIIAIINLLNWIIYIINTRKTLSTISIEQLNDELSQNPKKYSNTEIYLTNNYLISTYRGLHVFSYYDLIWIYLGNKGKFWPKYKTHMNIFLKGKIKYLSKSIDNSDSSIFNEIISEIINKNKKIMIGYTYENMDNYKKINNGG